MSATTPRWPAFGAVAVVALLVLSACSGGDGDGVATAGGAGNRPNPTVTGTPTLDPDSQALVFAGCMRANGVDMPDPGPGQQGLGQAFQAVAGNYDRDTMRKALAACQDLMPQYPGAVDHTDDDWMLKLAECLREQGLDVSDNPFNDAHSGKIDVREFSAAMEVCRNVLTGGGQ